MTASNLIDKTMNILCVAAHPDDTELLCAGTLARYAKDGHQVTIAIFTDGSIGDAVVKPDVLSVTREKEARNAAELIGANVIWMATPPISPTTAPV